MILRVRFLSILAVVGLLSSCGLVDSGIEWRGGPYALLWLDTSEDISICRDLGDGKWSERIDSTVFAVGWDGRYLVAKQHPDNDRNKTNYFIIDSKADAPNAATERVVTGPLTALEFGRKSVEMKLPGFTKILKYLE
jgi:hypothetical protein